MRRLGCLIGVLVVLGLAGGAISVLGTVLVVDRSGGVISASITDTAHNEQRLFPVPGGIFVTIPRMEGILEIHCRQGPMREGGYVTGYMSTWAKVTGNRRCERVIPID